MLTVTIPAQSHHLAPLNAVKAALGVTNALDDAWLGELILKASGSIRHHCNRIFELETVTETFRLARYMDSLPLARWPVVSVVSVLEEGVALATAAYEVDASSGALHRRAEDHYRPWVPGKVVVTYRAGFETIPAEVEASCIALVQRLYQSSEPAPLESLESQNLESQSPNRPSPASEWPGLERLTPEVAGKLARFRAPSCG